MESKTVYLYSLAKRAAGSEEWSDLVVGDDDDEFCKTLLSFDGIKDDTIARWTKDAEEHPYRARVHHRKGKATYRILATRVDAPSATLTLTGRDEATPLQVAQANWFAVRMYAIGLEGEKGQLGYWPRRLKSTVRALDEGRLDVDEFVAETRQIALVGEKWFSRE